MGTRSKPESKGGMERRVSGNEAAGEHSSFTLSLQGKPATDTLHESFMVLHCLQMFQDTKKGFVLQKLRKIDMEPPSREQNTLMQPR